MEENNLGNIFNKVKAATKRAADATSRQAKLTGLRIKLMTLHSQRNQHLQNIGTWLFSFYKQGKKFDQSLLVVELKDEIANIEQIDRQTEAIEAQIQAQEVDSEKVNETMPQ